MGIYNHIGNTHADAVSDHFCFVIDFKFVILAAKVSKPHLDEIDLSDNITIISSKINIKKKKLAENFYQFFMSWIGFIQGNQSSFKEIYDAHIDDLYGYGRQYHYDKDTVLDCIHDLFVSLFNNPKIAKEVNVKYYLFAALRRKLLRLKVQTVDIETLSEDISWTNSHELDLINDEVETKVVRVIKEKVDALPKRQREVLFLRYYLNFSYDEIARMMGVNVETCRTLSFRAIKQLKVELKPIELFTIFYIFFNKF